MPALPPVANCLKVLLKYGYGADIDVLNILHFEYTGSAPTATDCAALAGDVSTAWSGHLAAFMSNSQLLESVDVRDLASSSGADGQSATTHSGSRAGGNLAPGTAVLVNHHIARRYRGGKPRSYLPFFVTTDLQAAGLWSGTSTAALLTAWEAFIAAIVGASSGSTTVSVHCNVSYYQGFTNVPYGSPQKYRRVPTVRGTPVVDAITAYTINPAPASQRRRNLT